MTSSELYERQVAADMQHHRQRVEWLEAERPTWSDGTPVSKSDIDSMLKRSRLCLSDSTGMTGYGSADIEEASQ